MKIDFHFYTIYVLCKLAGIKEDYSKKIAYSSQHTDDAKYYHELEFQSGGRFQQQLSAHKFLDLRVFDKKTSYDIFLPFHFLPGIEGKDFYEKLLCRANSMTAKEMLEEALRTIEKPYGLHRLGVVLHVYADTWSHQGFHGLNKPHNEVNELETSDSYPWDLRELGVDIRTNLLPPLGHAQADQYPDEPYLIWRYRGYKKKKVEEINNLDRTLDAAYNIYSFLSNEVQKVHPVIFEKNPKDWEEIKDNLVELFLNENPIEEREVIWREKIEEGYFGFQSQIDYNDREWFKDAVIVIDDARKLYDKKENFHTSDWKYFHDALTIHKFYIKHELLPKYGIIT